MSLFGYWRAGETAVWWWECSTDQRDCCRRVSEENKQKRTVDEQLSNTTVTSIKQGLLGTEPINHLFIHSLIHSFIESLIQSTGHSVIHSFNQSFIH